MTVQELKQELGLTEFYVADGERQVTGAYMGDLLSWVMGRAQADQVWVTIMSNQNVAAVAALSDVSCVLLCENVQPDEDLLKKPAHRESICWVQRRVPTTRQQRCIRCWHEAAVF